MIGIVIGGFIAPLATSTRKYFSISNIINARIAFLNYFWAALTNFSMSDSLMLIARQLYFILYDLQNF